MITINGKEYRNLQEQVQKNMDDIDELKNKTFDGYTKEQSDAKYQTKSEMSSYVTNSSLELTLDTLTTAIDQELIDKQDKLISGTNIRTINGFSLLGQGNIVIEGSGSGSSFVGGNGIDINNGEISVDSDVVVTRDSLGNIDGALQVEHLISEDWDEDDDCKSEIFLYSGLRRSTIILDTDGEESGSRIYLSGTSAVDSEGTVEISGKTNFVTNNRITVNGDEEIAYLSDLDDVGKTKKYELAINIGALSRRFIKTFYADQGAYPTGTISDYFAAISYLSQGDIFYNTDDNMIYTFASVGQTLFLRRYDGTLYSINGQYPPVPSITVTFTHLD